MRLVSGQSLKYGMVVGWTAPLAVLLVRFTGPILADILRQHHILFHRLPPHKADAVIWAVAILGGLMTLDQEVKSLARRVYGIEVGSFLGWAVAWRAAVRAVLLVLFPGTVLAVGWSSAMGYAGPYLPEELRGYSTLGGLVMLAFLTYLAAMGGATREVLEGREYKYRVVV